MLISIVLSTILATVGDDVDDLKRFTERPHEGTRRCVSSTDGFGTFSTSASKFLFRLDTIEIENGVATVSGLATLPIVVTAGPDYLREGNQGVNRFDGRFKDGKLEMNCIVEFKDADGRIKKCTISMFGVLDQGRFEGYMTQKWDKPDGSTSTYGSVFSIDPH